MAKAGFTLMELLIVIVIVGILVTLAMVNYSGVREQTFDKEAKANLKLIQAAQRIYHMENTFFYPCAGCATPADTAGINSNLRLSLPTANPNWTYSAWGGATTGCARATASGTINTPVRSWFMRTNDADGEPDSGAGCP